MGVQLIFKKGHFLGLIFFLTTNPTFAVASPTSNEYLPCHQMAASALQHCLDEIPGYADDKCWDEAKRVKSACYGKVVESHHGPDRNRIEAEKALRKSLGGAGAGH